MTRRDAWMLTGLTLLLAVAVTLATALGTANVPPLRAMRILWDVLTGNEGDYPAWQRTVLLWVRLPRVLTAALVGGGLALTGAVMQAIFRNPMAEPGIIGVSAGAAFGAVTALYLGATTFSMLLAPTGAFIGALGCTFVVYALASSGRGRLSVTTLLLSGVAVGSIVSAMTSFVLALSLRQWEVGRQMLSWLMGDFEGRSWGHVALVFPLTLVGSVWLALHGRELNLLLTGEESALSLGIDVPALRRNLIVWASLVTADLVCRLASLSDLRPGVVTSLVGGPFFLYLLIRSRRAWVATV